MQLADLTGTGKAVLAAALMLALFGFQRCAFG